MIRILENAAQIEEAKSFLAKAGLSQHDQPEKNWDFFVLQDLVNRLDRSAPIVDLGCGGLYALKLLLSMGFRNLSGIDLHIALRDRLQQASLMAKLPLFHKPFHLFRGDLTKSPFPGDFFAAALCISVIEHGVDMHAFFSEAWRILRPKGILFITADYWQEKVSVSSANRPYSRPWNIFSKEEINQILFLAGRHRFSLVDKEARLPACKDKCVSWNGKDYTFVSLAFEKNP